MERKMSNDSRVLETAYNIVEQVNTLLVSAANPSDETSLSIRLSLIKVSLHIFEHSFTCIGEFANYTVLVVKNKLYYIVIFVS